MKVGINHPTDRANFSIVTIGDVDLGFSYETVVAVRRGYEEWQISPNQWGPTTGKHINYFKPDAVQHELRESFETAVMQRLDGRS